MPAGLTIGGTTVPEHSRCRVPGSESASTLATVGSARPPVTLVLALISLSDRAGGSSLAVGPGRISAGSSSVVESGRRAFKGKVVGRSVFPGTLAALPSTAVGVTRSGSPAPREC